VTRLGAVFRRRKWSPQYVSNVVGGRANALEIPARRGGRRNRRESRLDGARQRV